MELFLIEKITYNVPCSPLFSLVHPCSPLFTLLFL